MVVRNLSGYTYRAPSLLGVLGRDGEPLNLLVEHHERTELFADISHC